MVEEPPPSPGSQLERLTKTRDDLRAKANPTRQDAIKLQSVEKQIRQLQVRERNAAQATTPATTPDTIGGVTRGRYQPKNFDHYKFNNGTSVYRSVFEAIGQDPNLAVNRPLTWQNKILSDHVRDHFGFREVSVDPGTNPMFVRDTLLDFTRAAQDMANSLGMRTSLISLDGRLAFRIEQKGAKDYLGAYDGGTKTIHLVNDANSFGHEWIHALDHLLTERLLQNPQLQNLLSRHTRVGELDTRDGTQAAFAKLINTMFYDQGAEMLQWYKLEQDAAATDKTGKPTKAALEARRHLEALNKGASQQRIQPSEFRIMAAKFGKPDYWASAHEMLARTGEMWLARQMENNGVNPRGVVMPDEAYLNETDRRLKMTFPKDQERVDILNAYNDLFNRLKNDGIITGPTAPKADFPGATIGWARQTPKSVQRTTFGEKVRRELNGLAAGLRKFTPANFTNELLGGELRPKAPSGLSAKTRAADKMRTFLYSYGAVMKVIIARNPNAGGRALQAVYDKLAPSPASGRAVGETFVEDHRRSDNIWRNKMGQVFASEGYGDANSMSALEGDMIHHVMTTGRNSYPHEPLNLDPNAPGDTIPQNLVNIAGKLQNELLNPLYRELTDAGFDVGVAPNGYFPRIYDERAVYADPEGFVRAGTRMHQLMFDRDVGPPGDNPVRLAERWYGLTKAERATADPSIPPAMKDLRKNLRAQAETRQALEANPGDAALQAQLAQLEDEARQLAEDFHELVRDHIAEMAAADWKNRILVGDPLEFEKLGPSAKFLNTRELPPEADQIMREFMHTDPRVAIPRYIDSATRRMAWNRAFGKDPKELEALIQSAVDGGVSGPDVQRFQSLVNQATGRLTYKADRDVQQVSQFAHAMGAVTLMSRSAWSSLAEPINAALATGELGAAYHMFANQFQVFWDKASAHERAEIADMFGITTSAAYDSIMQSRTGANYYDSPATDRFMTQFFRASLLTQLTTAQRRAAVGTADWLLRKWSKDLLSKDTSDKAADRRHDAERWFNELGLASQGNNLRDQFANWMLSHDGPVPISELQTGEFRGVYGLALLRLADRFVQNPYKVDRPILAGTPVVGMAYQLMSFNYAYTKNVLEPMLHRMGHAASRGYQRSYDRAKAGGAGDFGAKARGFAGGARGFSREFIANAAIVATAIFASLLTAIPRQKIFSPDQWDEHKKNGDLGDWLIGLAVSRSGIGGTLDPLTQVYDNLRWNTDLSKLYEGAFPGWLLENLVNLIKPYTSAAESPNTNTQYYNQARSFYNLLFVPAEVLALTMMNAAGGPAVQAVSGGLMQYLTSPSVANKFASFTAGPKGSTLRASGSGDEEGPGMDDSGVPGLEGEEPDGKPSQPGAAPPGALANVPLSVMDDFIVPLVKVLEKPWQVLPGPAKLGVAAVAAALMGFHWWHETAPWRDHPNAPRKP